MAWQTDLALSALEGEVVHRNDYVLVRTPTRPNYFWDNYLLFPHPPEDGDDARWMDLYRREHPERKGTHWDTQESESVSSTWGTTSTSG